MQYNLADLWERVVDTVPERESLICGDRRLTYAHADERANRLAHHLAEQGVGPGDHVALYLYNGTEYLEGMLAAFKLRAVPVNINHRYVERELLHLFNDADLVALIVHGAFSDRVAKLVGEVATLRDVIVVDDGTAVAGDLEAVDY